MSQIELIAAATFGLEAVVAREVESLGYSDVKVQNARVTFTGMKVLSAVVIFGCGVPTGF